MNVITNILIFVILSVIFSLIIVEISMAHLDNRVGIAKFYGIVGFANIIISWLLAIRDVGVVDVFFTPLAWTGYILVVDSVIFHLRGHSLIANKIGSLLYMLPASVICWLIFEAYNLHIQNWHYVNLPNPMVIRVIGYMWSFATIFPAIFLSTELFEIWDLFARVRIKPRKMSKERLIIYFVVGLICLVVPVVLPYSLAKYTIALVWVGFVFLLEPVNYILGGKSLLAGSR